MSKRSMTAPAGWHLESALASPASRLPRLRFFASPDPSGGAGGGSEAGGDDDSGGEAFIPLATEKRSEGQPPPDLPDLTEGGKKALETERAARKAAEKQVRQLQKQLGVSADPQSGDTDPAVGGGEESTEARIAALEARAAQAEEDAAAARVQELRTRLSSGVLPDPIAALLTGTTEDEITAQIEQIAPFILTRPGGGVMLPNPQQGNPSKTRASGKAEGAAEADRRFGKKP